MQPNLIDAARAVIAADRAGELTDELITVLEKELTRAETPRGRGPYGVDTGYFDRKLARIIPALDNYTPADLAREFARMAAVADRDAAFAELAPTADTKPAGEPVAYVKRWTNSSVIDSTGCKTCWEDLPDGTALYTNPQVVPAECSWKDAPWMSADTEPSVAYMDGWNACRKAMLTAAPAPAQVEPPAPGSGRGVMFVDFVSALAAKAGYTELAADLLAAIRAAGETGIQGLPAPGEPACHIAEASDEEVAIACTPAQRLLLREGMQLYAAPVAGGAIQVRKLGVFGKVYDGPQEKRAYTYKDQPHNVAAWRLGRAAVNVSAGGDHIDRGLSLLASLQAEGFGVFEMEAAEQEGGAA